MVETVDALCKQGETTLTIEALKRHALQPDQRVRMEMEARTGERKVELAKAQSEQELKRLLGNPVTLPGTTPADHSANGASDLSAFPDTTKSTGSKTRIERAATRDLVENGEYTQMHLSWRSGDRTKAFSGQWHQACGMPQLCKNALTGTAQWSPPVSVS